MKSAHLFNVVVLTCLVTTLTLALVIFDDLRNYPARTFSWIDASAQRSMGPGSGVLGDSSVSAIDYTNLPILSFDASQTPDLAGKINSTEEMLSQLDLHYQRVSGEVVLMGLKWDTLNASDITRSIDTLVAILGEAKQLEWLTGAWGWPQLDTIGLLENEVKTDLAALRGIVSTSGAIPVAFTQLKLAITSLDQITALIGEKTDTAEQTTIYGRYQKVRAEVNDWDSLKSQLDQELAGGDLVKLAELEARVLALNQIPHTGGVLSVTGNNRWLDLIALAQANKLFLAQDRGSILTTTWLEDNPVVFKTLIANSSPLTRQEAAIKYYLPVELKEDDIVARDGAVEVKFDPDKKQLLVQGQVTVAAGDTRTISVETADIWHFDSLRIDKASFQAAQLAKALADSPQEADAIAWKSSVDASMKKVVELQNQNYSPESRIKAFRQISLEMEIVNQNLARLGQLVSKTNSGVRWSKLSASSWVQVPWGQIVPVLIGLALLVTGVGMLKQSPTLPSRQFHTFSKDVTSSDL